MGKQTTLGDLIDALEPIKDKEGSVKFDFGNAVPTYIDSDRGYYEDLAIAFAGEYGYSKQIRDFYKDLVSCNGKVFVGWKGGDYTMNRETLIWVACRGNTSSTVIVGVEIETDDNEHYYVTLITEEQYD